MMGDLRIRSRFEADMRNGDRRFMELFFDIRFDVFLDERFLRGERRLLFKHRLVVFERPNLQRRFPASRTVSVVIYLLTEIHP